MRDDPLSTAQRLHGEIKNILLNEWDPIGVRDIPEAEDEYDAYVPSIYKMIIQRKHVSETSDYLLWVEGEHMGLCVNRQRVIDISDRLAQLGS